ncbi:hypothetical protein YYC_05586 [Plasmodium yoelii 17X]|uniref:YIR protein n=1 Tax=Plasmodium yoelii 17X TaxID=1323249 RepID=V7PA61_PLAYE|nr:hypothetical protein YYC_05586 [Plasmodium yoelii 17X]
MDDTLCGKIYFLRAYLPDDSSVTTKLELKSHENLNNYCPITRSEENECNNDLDEITAGFLWLLGECYSTIINRSYNEDNTNAFFLYIISWLSYKLNKSTENRYTTINDFYTNHIINSGKYDKFVREAYTISDLKEFIDKQNDLLKINIEDLSKFYDAFKLLCNIYGDFEKSTDNNKLSSDATSFVNKYKELNNDYTIEGTARSKILSVLLTDYNNLKNEHKDVPSLPEITTNLSALKSENISSSSSIGNKLLTVLSIFGAIAFFLGISYKYSLFGFRKRAQKQYLREKIKNIKKKMNY